MMVIVFFWLLKIRFEVLNRFVLRELMYDRDMIMGIIVLKIGFKWLVKVSVMVLEVRIFCLVSILKYVRFINM